MEIRRYRAFEDLDSVGKPACISKEKHFTREAIQESNQRKDEFFKLIAFFQSEQVQELLKENKIEEIYTEARSMDIRESSITHIFRDCYIDTLPYVKKIRCGMFSIGDWHIGQIEVPSNIEEIESEAIQHLPELHTVIIGVGVKTIRSHAFVGDDKLTQIQYKGTKAEWERIEKCGFAWLLGSGIEQVECSDAVIDIKHEYEVSKAEEYLSRELEFDFHALDDVYKTDGLIQDYKGDKEILKEIILKKLEK